MFSGDGARSATSARIAIAAGSSGGRGVSLSQNGVSSSGGWLSLALYARASNAQALKLALKSGGAMLWEQGLTLPAAANNSAFRQYFFMLSTAAFNNTSLSIETGQNPGDVWIDAVHLCPAPVKLSEEFDGAALNGSLWRHRMAFSRDCAVEDLNGTREWHSRAPLECGRHSG